ncbi:hypothetical protein [Levilactobacillus zymae]|uniref:Uncharacterized protein n=1 Tax=Levilactobacillus zymae TaxID=267363 RepID=A0A1Y6JX42_9LACO|nr:hypothetical protein [Levilactobacillus zymae]KRL16601.1 hypothetical protein FD38_GL000030 [Levilactobacillus zymae DSM 19395]QFR60599.1 hypothetical protein LZ395_03250 [Levilactobacillus zymae]GEO72706.1 hypothetical protein LZY01_18740 [Levilactobacillus zymae]SMS14370.1 hypothetical protein LZ3411_1320 [Levilactobacillus zymae]
MTGVYGDIRFILESSLLNTELSRLTGIPASLLKQLREHDVAVASLTLAQAEKLCAVRNVVAIYEEKYQQACWESA